MNPGKKAILKRNLHLLLNYRQATPEDLNLIKNSWFRSYLAGNGVGVADIPYPTYEHGQTRLINGLLNDNPTLIAYLTKTPTEILGWANFGKHADVVHFVYTKLIYRDIGVARHLLTHERPGVPMYYTHRTRDGDTMFKKLNSKWNPYLLCHYA